MWQLKLPSLWNWKPGKRMPGAPAAIRNHSLFATVHTAEASSNLSFSKRRKRKPPIYANANTRTTNHTVTARTKVCLSFSKKPDLLKRSSFFISKQSSFFKNLFDLFSEERYVRYGNILKSFRQSRLDKTINNGLVKNTQNNDAQGQN